MKTVKQINDELKALYENKEPDYLEECDKRILRYERAGLANKERWDNYTPEERQRITKNITEKNYETWSNKGVYVLRSPGKDLLNYYDHKWQEYVDDIGVGKIYKKNHGRNGIGLIPPSAIYKLRFQTDRNRKTFKTEAWKILSQYVDQDSQWGNYYLDCRDKMHKWLTQENSKSYEFVLLEELYDFMDEHLNMKVHRGEIRPHAEGNNHSDNTLWWRKEAAGWSIVYKEKG